MIIKALQNLMSRKSESRKAKGRQAVGAAVLECLEGRQMMSIVPGTDLTTGLTIVTPRPAITADGTLVVYGTANADNIQINTSGNNVVVTRGLVTVWNSLFNAFQRIAVYAGSGNDTVTNSARVLVTLNGGDGNDTLRNRSIAAATLNGDGGNDVLIGQLVASDTFNGGDGTDIVSYAEYTFDTRVTFDGIANDGYQGSAAVPCEADNVGWDVERLNGGSGADTFTVQPGYGWLGKVLDGGGGSDTLTGGSGSDTLVGGPGFDHLYGGDGDDYLLGGTEGDYLNGQEGLDSLYGEAGVDTLIGLTGDDVLSGGAGNDTLDVTLEFSRLLRTRGRSIIPANEYTAGTAGVDSINLKLDLGSFVSQGIRPTLSNVQRVTRGLQPFADLYNWQIPVLSTFDSGATVGHLLDVGGSFRPFVDRINAINSLTVPDFYGTVNYGRFEVSATGLRRADTFNPFASNVFTSTYNKLNNLGLSFTVLKDPMTAAKLSLGQDVNLFSCELPSFNLVVITPTVTIPVFSVGGVLNVSLTLGLAGGLHAGGGFGMDSSGLRSGNLGDGFFARADTGASMFLKLTGGVSVDVWLAGASFNGGLQGRVGIGLYDPNNDGKVRLSEMGPAGSNPVSFYGQINYNVSVTGWVLAWSDTEEIASGSFRLFEL